MVVYEKTVIKKRMMSRMWVYRQGCSGKMETQGQLCRTEIREIARISENTLMRNALVRSLVGETGE